MGLREGVVSMGGRERRREGGFGSAGWEESCWM